jgi:hypothetical protein
MKNLNKTNVTHMVLIVSGFILFLLIDSLLLILTKAGSLFSVYMDTNPTNTVVFTALIYLSILLIGYLFIRKKTRSETSGLLTSIVKKGYLFIILLVIVFLVAKYYMNFLYNENVFKAYSYEKVDFFDNVFFLERLSLFIYRYLTVLLLVIFLVKRRKLL